MVAITKVVRRVPSRRQLAVVTLTAVGFTVTVCHVVLLVLQHVRAPGRHDKSNIQVVIQPSICREGPTGNMSITSLSSNEQQRRRRGDYPSYHHISQIVEGPALVQSFVNGIHHETTTTTTTAICKFRQIKYWYHFPHTMQQLYRCWSWWIANPDKEPVLIFQHHKKTRKNAFLLDFFGVLEKEINLQIVKSHNGPYVQAKDTGMWDNDIEITDYAMFDAERKLRQVFAPHIPDHIPDPPCRRGNQKDMHRLPKIAILNRAVGRSGRHLLNANELVSSIEQTFPGQNVPIVYFENKTMLEQVKFFMESDIVISPHGAQLTGIAFMKNCSTLVEFFPKDYLTADYFGSLAASVGVNHKYFYLSDNEKEIQSYERYHYIPTTKFRDGNQCPQMETVMTALVDVIQNWRPCCAPMKPSTLEKPVPTVVDSSNNNNDQIHPIIDIVSTGSLARSVYLDTQQQTFGSHRFVRDFYPITELNDTDNKCGSDYDFDQFQQQMSTCSILKEEGSVARQFQSDLFGPNSNATEWQCVQRLPIDGLYLALERYKSGVSSIPSYLILIDDDTYLNMDALARTFRESYSPNDNHLFAGCTYLGEKKSHFVYPVGGVGSMMTRATIEKIMTPIHCETGGDDQEKDPFTRWACWRLHQNLLGERRYFKDGMSVADLMKAYSSGQPFGKVDEWDNIGYCFHSDHTLAYFFNYYHVSVPDWLLNETIPTDTIRKLHSYKKLAGSSEDGHTGNGGECDNLYKQCTAESRICHSVETEQMTTIYNKQQSTAGN